MDLLHALRRAQYKACLVTLAVGSRGLLHMPGFVQLREQLHLDTKTFQSMLIQISSVAVAASFKVWCTRNQTFSPSQIIFIQNAFAYLLLVCCVSMCCVTVSHLVRMVFIVPRLELLSCIFVFPILYSIPCGWIQYIHVQLFCRKL